MRYHGVLTADCTRFVFFFCRNHWRAKYFLSYTVKAFQVCGKDQTVNGLAALVLTKCLRPMVSIMVGLLQLERSTVKGNLACFPAPV